MVEVAEALGDPTEVYEAAIDRFDGPVADLGIEVGGDLWRSGTQAPAEVSELMVTASVRVYRIDSVVAGVSCMVIVSLRLIVVFTLAGRFPSGRQK